MKKTSRLRGLLLMGTGALVFLGTSLQRLPAEAFFPAAALCLLGTVIFMKANREATDVANQRIRRALDPEIRNQTTERFANRQADTDGRNLAAISPRGARGRAPATSHRSAPVSGRGADEIELVDVDGSGDSDETGGNFEVTTDVSFPVELQESRSLAEQLQKLQRLCEDGVITVEEFSIAKAKLLR